jgi:APA family basic amino acid/polyamine antiporter
MAGAILVSMAGWMNGAVLSTSRIYQAMAEDGLFLKGAASLNAKGVPAAAMAAQALWACLLALTGTFGQLLEYSIFAGLLWYLVVVSAVIVARVRRPDLPRPYRVPLYPVLPLLYIAGALAILAMLLVHRPWRKSYHHRGTEPQRTEECLIGFRCCTRAFRCPIRWQCAMNIVGSCESIPRR